MYKLQYLKTIHTWSLKFIYYSKNPSILLQKRLTSTD